MEAALRRLPGVLGAVALPGSPAEVQLFVGEGADVETIRAGARQQLAGHGHAGARLLVFEMLVEVAGEEFAPEPAREEPAAPWVATPTEPPHAREGKDTAPLGTAPGTSLAAAPTRRNNHRPRLASVELVTREQRMVAHVELSHRERDLPGAATSRASRYGLAVTATATADAVAALLDPPAVDVTIEDAVLIEVSQRLAVAVLVRWDDGQLLLGTSLADDRPLHEAAARATLDAINRRLARHFLDPSG